MVWTVRRVTLPLQCPFPKKLLLGPVALSPNKPCDTPSSASLAAPPHSQDEESSVLKSFWNHGGRRVAYDGRFLFQMLFLGILLAIHLLGGFKDSEEDFEPGPLSPLTFLVVGASFILAFFVNVSFDKYQTQGKLMLDLMGSLYDLTILYKANLGNNPSLQSRLTRYSCAIFYFNMFDMAGYWDYDLLEGLGLLTQEERGALEDTFSPSFNGRANILVTWTMAALEIEYTDVASGDVHPNYSRWRAGHKNLIQNQVLRVRSKVEAIRAERRIVVPKMYSYGLVVVLMTVLTLSGLCVSVVFDPWQLEAWVLLIGHVLACAVLLGLYSMATDMLEPFGSDKTDLPIINWMTEQMEGQTTLLLSCTPGEDGALTCPIHDLAVRQKHQFGIRWSLRQFSQMLTHGSNHSNRSTKPAKRCTFCRSLDTELAEHLRLHLSPAASGGAQRVVTNWEGVAMQSILGMRKSQSVDGTSPQSNNGISISPKTEPELEPSYNVV
ncbi:unnamed protein product [Chrysoparadoxa australica]